MKYLKIDQLKDDYLYKIRARNANYGIWISQRKSFIISRVKFGNNFLFEEYHWDCEAFATVQPLEEIEKSQFKSEDINIVNFVEGGKEYWGYSKEEEILEYLNKFEPREHFFQLLSEKEKEEIRKKNLERQVEVKGKVNYENRDENRGSFIS